MEAKHSIKKQPLGLPVIDPGSLVPNCPNSQLELKIPSYEVTPGNISKHELAVMILITKLRNVKTVFEFGTFDGRTTATLAANLGVDADIMTIDLPAADAGGAKLPISDANMGMIRKDRIGAKLEGLANVTQLYGNTAGFDFSPWCGTRDFVFVDACHDYEYVRNDTEIALKLLKPHGLIFWHDYGSWPDVARALEEYRVSDSRLSNLKCIECTTFAVLER